MNTIEQLSNWSTTNNGTAWIIGIMFCAITLYVAKDIRDQLKSEKKEK